MNSSVPERDIEHVGLVGVGSMGRRMLEKLKGAGFQVAAFDPSPEARSFIEQTGGLACESPARVAALAKVIFLSLPHPSNVFEAVKSMLESLSAEHVIVDTSTVSPATTREAASIAGCKGAGYVDAPVLGRPVNPGAWLLPAGGKEKDIERIRPYAACFAKSVARVGDSGAGCTFKLLNQMMFAAINCITAEVMALTDIMGIDGKLFRDTVADSGAATVSGLFKETSARMAEDRFDDPNFTLELMCKDSALGLQMAKDAGVVPLVSTFIQSISEHGKAKGLARQDTSALVRLFREYYSKFDKAQR